MWVLSKELYNLKAFDWSNPGTLAFIVALDGVNFIYILRTPLANIFLRLKISKPKSN